MVSHGSPWAKTAAPVGYSTILFDMPGALRNAWASNTRLARRAIEPILSDRFSALCSRASEEIVGPEEDVVTRQRRRGGAGLEHPYADALCRRRGRHDAYLRREESRREAAADRRRRL